MTADADPKVVETKGAKKQKAKNNTFLWKYIKKVDNLEMIQRRDFSPVFACTDSLRLRSGSSLRIVVLTFAHFSSLNFQSRLTCLPNYPFFESARGGRLVPHDPLKMSLSKVVRVF